IRFGIRPDVPVRSRIIAACAALHEPWMLVGAVAQHLVDDDPQAGTMRTVHQPIEVLEIAEYRVYATVVADVVPEVLHRRTEKWRYPHGVDTQACDVTQLVDDAAQVTDTIAV